MSVESAPSVRALAVLFKEILELIPEEDAARLMDGHRSGRTVELYIGHSSFDSPKRTCKTAFSYRLTDDQTWRNLPDTASDTVQ